MSEGKQKDRILQINKKQINEKDQIDKKVNSGEEEMDNVKKHEREVTRRKKDVYKNRKKMQKKN